MRRYLTALRPVYVQFREAEPDQLHDAWCPATAAKRHPEGQRDDGLTRDGRVTARRERIFFSQSRSPNASGAAIARQCNHAICRSLRIVYPHPAPDANLSNLAGHQLLRILRW